MFIWAHSVEGFSVGAVGPVDLGPGGGCAPWQGGGGTAKLLTSWGQGSKERNSISL